MAYNTTYGGALVKPNPPSISQMPVPVTAPKPPVGTKAVNPANNVKPASTALPPNQVAPKDLSGTYARLADGTIINKSSQAKFSNPGDFFKDSGVGSFDNLKFDTAYKPSGKETIYGQPAANPAIATPPANPPPPNPAPVAAPPVAPPANQPYTPPNQGTTGVSQGGIIGNLIGMAQNETPQVAKARGDLKALEESYAKRTGQIEATPGDLSLASGLQGILGRLFAAKQGAAQTALSSALTSQGQQIGATTSAGSLNAPIITPYGQQQINPSQPIAGSTTSGAANIGSVVGQRVGADGKTQEFYNSQTGQGFATPEELANFVNQQVPGAGATAQNVFQKLDQLKSQQGGNQSGGALNPLNNLTSIAADVLSGRRSLKDAESMGGSVAGWTGVLNAELQKQSGGAFDASAAQAKYDANQAVQGNQAQQRAQYQVAHQQAKNLGAQLDDLVRQHGLNPDDINLVNSFRQLVGNNTSDWRYVALQNYVNDLASTYAQILTPPGGSQTDMVRSIATSMLDPNMSAGGLKAVIGTLNAAAEAKIAGTNTPSTTNPASANNTGGGSGGGVSGGGLFNW